MHLECHATLGWVLGNALGSSRQIRIFAVAGSILPDIDAVPYIFGEFYYGLLHHTFGHNIFLGILFGLYGWKRFGSYKIGLLGLVVFALHILADAWFSNWQLYLLWPFSPRGWLPANSLELASPVNTGLLYSTPLVLALVALVWKRTPLEWIHPKLDELFISFFRKKTLACAECMKGANLACEGCGRSVCPRHCRLGKNWKTVCGACFSSGRKGGGDAGDSSEA